MFFFVGVVGRRRGREVDVGRFVLTRKFEFLSPIKDLPSEGVRPLRPYFPIHPGNFQFLKNILDRLWDEFFEPSHGDRKVGHQRCSKDIEEPSACFEPS